MENGQTSPINIDDELSMEQILEETPLEVLEQTTAKIKKTVDALERGVDKILKNQEALQREVVRLSQQKRDDPKTKVLAKKKKPMCEECDGPHRIFECPSLTPGERFSHAIAADLCMNCNNRHNGDCIQRTTCTKCEKKHLTLYHS